MLLRQPGGRVMVAGSVGMDDLSVRALDAWSGQEAWWRRKGDGASGRGKEAIEVRLERRSGRADAMSTMNCGAARVLPMRASTGEMLGALAVSVEEMEDGRERGVRDQLMGAIVEQVGRDLEEVLRRTGGLVQTVAETKGEVPGKARVQAVAAGVRALRLSRAGDGHGLARRAGERGTVRARGTRRGGWRLRRSRRDP